MRLKDVCWFEMQHQLPPLRNIDNVQALTGPQATAYLVGYGLPHVQAIAAQQRAIEIEIGCTD